MEGMNPDSPDEIAFGQLHAPISTVRSSPYAGSSSRILTDPTGESKESAVWSAFPRPSVLPVQSIRGIRDNTNPGKTVCDIPAGQPATNCSLSGPTSKETHD